MKAIYLGLMCRRYTSILPVISSFYSLIVYRLIMAELGESEMDDRDFYGNKRLELAGSLLALLFEDVFKRYIISRVRMLNLKFDSRFNSELKRIADNSLNKTLAAPLDIVKHMRQVCV